MLEGTLPIIGMIQCTAGLALHPNQKREMGMKKEPTHKHFDIADNEMVVGFDDQNSKSLHCRAGRRHLTS